MVWGGVDIQLLDHFPGQPPQLQTHRIYVQVKEEGMQYIGLRLKFWFAYAQEAPGIQQHLLSRPYPKTGDKWLKRTQALASFIMKDARPLSIISGVGFKVYCKEGGGWTLSCFTGIRARP